MCILFYELGLYIVFSCGRALFVVVASFVIQSSALTRGLGALELSSSGLSQI